MTAMPIFLRWHDVILRLALTVLAGALLGFDRSEAGKVAGLRTTLLVALAACIAMLQANALLGQAGKAVDSFVTLDLMRLPLGIFSGVGFIGAGAILHDRGYVLGVTTAATMWFVTALGLCFGGGQFALGISGLVLAVFILWTLKSFERKMARVLRAYLTVGYDRKTISGEEIAAALKAKGYRVMTTEWTCDPASERCEERIEVKWRGHSDDTQDASIFLAALDNRVTIVRWSLDR